LTFAAGTTRRTFTVTVLGDQIAEANETFFVTLANAVNAGISRAGHCHDCGQRLSRARSADYRR
jgi:hypothetical protein